MAFPAHATSLGDASPHHRHPTLRSQVVAEIDVEELEVRYGPTVAVDRLSLQAHAGAVLVLLGPNGAGKTSTVEAMEGYRVPASGRVRVLGLDPRRDHRALSARIGVMLQRGGIYPTMPAGEALGLFAKYYPAPAEPIALLDRVGLTAAARTPWRRLSGGEQQRLSLALAMVGQPEVVFLDEPTAGVDPEGRLAIRAIVAELRDRGVCVVLTTHELDEAERLADRIVIVDRGRVVAEGSPAALMTGFGGDHIRFGAPPGIDASAMAGAVGAAVGGQAAVTAREDRPGEYVVDVPPTPQAVAALTAWLAERDLPLADLRAGRERLEDVFLRLTRSGARPDADAPAARRGRR